MISAFIFARGGSKGLAGKNTKILCGNPLLAYAIDAAKKSRYIEEVLVSTDCPKIADIARQCGAEIINRPSELATDDSPEWLSWQHAIRQKPCTLFVSVPATVPQRTANDIDKCIESLAYSDCDMAVAIHRAKGIRFTVPLNCYRRQDTLEYDISGAVYAARSSFIASAKSMADGYLMGVEIPRYIDIDDENDFLMAESLIRHRNRAVSVAREDTSAA